MSRPNLNSAAASRQTLVERLEFLGQMGSTETALFHQKAAEAFGLGITDMKTVSTLMQEGPMSAGQIAGRLHLTTGAVTNLLDRLEAYGVIERASDPNDRRKVIAKVKMDALKEGSKLYDSMGNSYKELLSHYTTKELEFLVEYHARQIEITKAEIAKLAKMSKA